MTEIMQFLFLYILNIIVVYGVVRFLLDIFT